MNNLGPLGICVTWGAGGSTQDRSLDLAGLTQSEYGIDTLLHLTCTNIVQERLDDALKVFSMKSFSHFKCGERAINPRFTSAGSKISRNSEYFGFERRYDKGMVCQHLQLTLLAVTRSTEGTGILGIYGSQVPTCH